MQLKQIYTGFLVSTSRAVAGTVINGPFMFDVRLCPYQEENHIAQVHVQGYGDVNVSERRTDPLVYHYENVRFEKQFLFISAAYRP